MGCACSKSEEVSDEPFQASKPNESRQSSARYSTASAKSNLSQPLINRHQQQQEKEWKRPQKTQIQDPQAEQRFIKHASGIEAQQPDIARRISSKQGRESKVLESLWTLPRQNEGEQVAAGWPAWLSEVAGEAIKGWIPRRADSFEKLEKIGQGTYSNVYKARDLEFRKTVALKKVRVDTTDAESVRFMAREIHVLRRLDHPNVIKLEGLVTSRTSCSLYLVFEYMEHDLAGLMASPGILFTEPQVKCYVKQLLCGLEHCHERGVLHRDIKGANLLLDNSGILRIADFGLATFFRPDQNQSLTSRVVTLWYRPPELLLGATEYGIGVDLWSTGCILAELLAGKPIMPARTEVEQLHKIFKLCGSPSDEYWKKSKLPHATIFKPQQPYKRCIAETFKHFPPSSVDLLDNLLSIEPSDRGTASQALRSEFFTTPPYACDPSSLPQYPPSKEWDAKIREEENRRQRDQRIRNDAAIKRQTSMGKDAPNKAAPDANAELQPSSLQKRQLQSHSNFQTGRSEKFKPPTDARTSQGLQAEPAHQVQLPTASCKVAPASSSRSGPLGAPLMAPARKKKAGNGEDVRMAPSRPLHRSNMSISSASFSQGVNSHTLTANKNAVGVQQNEALAQYQKNKQQDMIVSTVRNGREKEMRSTQSFKDRSAILQQ